MIHFNFTIEFIPAKNGIEIKGGMTNRATGTGEELAAAHALGNTIKNYFEERVAKGTPEERANFKMLEVTGGCVDGRAMAACWDAFLQNIRTSDRLTPATLNALKAAFYAGGLSSFEMTEQMREQPMEKANTSLRSLAAELDLFLSNFQADS